MEKVSISDFFRKQVISERAPQIHPGATHLMPQDFQLPVSLVDDELLRELAQIPDRLGYKIGEVAELLGVKPYVLRYWESEFPELRPSKAANQQRCYTRKEVEMAFLIRKLLHRDKVSVEGAKGVLKNSAKSLQEFSRQLRKSEQNRQLAVYPLQKIIARLNALEKKVLNWGETLDSNSEGEWSREKLRESSV